MNFNFNFKINQPNNSKIRLYQNKLNNNKLNNNTITLEQFILNNKITHVSISDSLKQFEKRFLEKYKLFSYEPDIHDICNTLFFGFYDNNDFNAIYNHKGNAFLMFGGTDLSNNFIHVPIEKEKLRFVCISNDIYIRLINTIKKTNIYHTLKNRISIVDFNMEYIYQNIKNKCIIAVIPVFGREPLLKYTIRRLLHKNKVDNVIVIGESESEYKTALDEGAIFLKHENKPLGKKWNAGYMFAKKFNPDALLFVGSSDWISSDWLNKAYNEILDGAGYVGKNDFYMFDITKKQKKFCKWFGYTGKRKNETIGIGRVISRKLLDKLNFRPFTDDKNNSMDYSMYLNCINYKMPIKILENESIFLSISCDLWENMHKFNLHYYPLINQNMFSKNREGCKNINKEIIDGVEFEKCDIHKDCISDINNYNTYKSLYDNGCLLDEEYLKKIYLEFPEINEFYKDYLKIYHKKN